MRRLFSCERCGSAESIEFGMCQVCYQDYSLADYPAGREWERLLGEGGQTKDDSVHAGISTRRNADDSTRRLGKDEEVRRRKNYN